MKIKLDTMEKIEMLLDELRKTVINITFTKKDGTERSMNCTLKECIIPKEFRPKQNTKVVIEEDETVEPDLIRVFDVDVQGWRSIILDNVKSVSNA
jgi:hypothetical protein